MGMTSSPGAQGPVVTQLRPLSLPESGVLDRGVSFGQSRQNVLKFTVSHLSGADPPPPVHPIKPCLVEKTIGSKEKTIQKEKGLRI